MATRKIVQLGDNVLRKVCKPVEEFNTNLHMFLDDMKETLTNAVGLGLAAPQVAVLKRVCIIVDGNRGDENIIELINPKITKTSNATIIENEGCLSIKGQKNQTQFQKVERPKWVVVEFQNRNGEPVCRKFSGYIARAVCHEIDHLDGILYIDKIYKGEKVCE